MMRNGVFLNAKSHILQTERTPFETVTVAVPLKIIPLNGLIKLYLLMNRHF